MLDEEDKAKLALAAVTADFIDSIQVDKSARHNAAVRGLAQGQIEGKIPSPEFEADVRRWVAGEITMTDLLQKVLDRIARQEEERGQDAV